MKTVLIMTSVVLLFMVNFICSQVGYVAASSTLTTLPTPNNPMDIGFIWQLSTFQVQGLGWLSTLLMIFNIGSIIFIAQLLRGD